MSDSLKLCFPTTIRGLADFINVGVCPIEPDKHLCAIRVNRACGRHRILSRESGKDVRWRDAQRRQPWIGKLDKYPLLLFAHNIHLLDPRHVEKSLPEIFGHAVQFAQRHTRSFDRVERERDVRVFVVHERPDCALR